MNLSKDRKEIPLDHFQKIFATANDHSVLASCIGMFSSWLCSMRLPEDLISDLKELYIPLINLLRQEKYLLPGKVILIGISGSQGSGKSTFTTLLANLLIEAYHYRVVTFSIDDFYHTRATREELSRTVHPLLKTRGVPGTHDVRLALEVLRSLMNADPDTETSIPVFDKSIDDRKARNEWNVFRGRPDVILFEGWCVGALPESTEKLAIPVNDLEEKHDQHGIFRNFVNGQLAAGYREWFSKIDFLVMLKVPSFDLVYDWRLLQEKKLADHVKMSSNSPQNLKIMTEEEVRFFISHYERITKHMLEEMPDRANLVLLMGKDHRFTGVRYQRAHL